MRFVRANGAGDSTSKDGSRRCSFLTSKNASPNSRGHQGEDSTGSRRQATQVFGVPEYKHCFSSANFGIKGGDLPFIRFLGLASPYDECPEPSLGLGILAYSGSKIVRDQNAADAMRNKSLKLKAGASHTQASSPIVPRLKVTSVRAWTWRPSSAQITRHLCKMRPFSCAMKRIETAPGP